jgi:hypothetical protein
MTGVVDGVLPAPVIIRGEGQYAGDEANRVVGLAGFEKRAVPAVVEDDKHPHEKGSRQHRQRHGDPPRHRQAAVHQTPKERVGTERVDDLPERPPGRRLLEFGHNLFHSMMSTGGVAIMGSPVILII